jgi:hypothetical protein
MEITFQQIDDDELRRRLQAAATGNPAPAHDFFAQFDYNIYLNNQQFLQALSERFPCCKNYSISTLMHTRGFIKEFPFISRRFPLSFTQLC